MSKFKVGDRVRIVHTDYQGEGLDVGTVHEVAELFNFGIGLRGSCAECNLYFSNGEVVTYMPSPNAIQLNHEYTSKNGQKWECIAIRGDVAWLVGVHEGKADGAAYMYKLDGSAVCLRTSPHVYDINWEPVVEWLSFALKQEHYGVIHHATLKYPVVDGKPDFTQATVTPA